VSTRRLLLGIDGPEVRTPAVVAHLVAPMARTWLDAAKAGASREAVAELEQWVQALELAASAFRRSVSAECAVDGQVGPDASHTTDAQVVTGITTMTAGDRLGLDPRSVTRLIGTELRGTKVGREWLIDPVSVEALRARREAA
jgi:hypothetical protein